MKIIGINIMDLILNLLCYVLYLYLILMLYVCFINKIIVGLLIYKLLECSENY